jgi:hypothetical protein
MLTAKSTTAKWGHDLKHLFLVLGMVLLFALPAQAITFFDEDFEYANSTALKAAWPSSCTPTQHDAQLTTSTTQFHSGSRSLKYTYVGDASGQANNCFMDKFYSARTEIWIREWIFLEAFSGIAAAPTKHLFSGGTSNGLPTGTDTYPNGWTEFNSAVQLGSQWQGSGGEENVRYFGTIPQGQWTCVEWRFKMNTPDVADGIRELWVNGVQRQNQTNMLIRRTAIVINGVTVNTSASVFNKTRLYRQHGNGAIYLDDYAVGDTRIGCGGPPPPVDTTPPLPPTNLSGNAATSTLTWTAGSDPGSPSSGYVGVQIFRCTRNPGDCTPNAQIAVVNAPTTSYTDLTAQSGFTYDYYIRSVDGIGLVSLFTSEVSLTIPTTNRRVLFTDLFNRADNASIGASYNNGTYTGSFAFKIAGARLAPTTATQNNHIASYTTAIPNDQWGSIRVSDGVSATDNFYVLMRMSAPATWNGYECAIVNSTTGRLGRTDAGVRTVLSTNTLSTPFVIGDRLRGESVGTTHRCYVIRTNAQGQQTEELVATASDGTYASGIMGIRVAADALPSIRIDEFLVGDFTGVVDSSITHDSTATSAVANTATSLNWVHTVGTSSNRILTACLQTRNLNSAVTVNSVTANGIGFAKFREDTRVVGTSSIHTSLWRQINPIPGANTITATFSAAPSSYAVGSTSSFFGAEQVTPIDAVGGANGTGTAISLPITTTVANTLAVDCVLSLDPLSSAGGSQAVLRNNATTTNNDGIGSSRKTIAAAGATTTTWTNSTATDWVGSVIAIKPAQVNNLQRPMVLTGQVTASGATGLSYSTTPPTALKVVYGPNSGLNTQEFNVPIASVPGGVLSFIWPACSEFAQIFAVDAFGIVNGQNLEYLAQSLIGIAPPCNTTAVVMTNPQPSTELPAGTTAATISMTIDQTQSIRECRWSDTDQAYDSMSTSNQMTINGTFASATKTGLSNGQSYTVYRTCIVRDATGEVVAESAARSASTFTVANSTGDTTPPANVTNVVCLANGTQADCTHSAATDAVSYIAYISSGACSTYNVALTYVATSFTIPNLSPLQTYCIKVKAVDVVGNLSAADSNISTFLMPALTDVTPPGNVPSLAIQPFATSVQALFGVGADAVSTTIEYCSGAGCEPGAFSKTGIASPITIEGLTEGATYRFTAYHTDAAGNNSVSKYTIIEIVTPSTGLNEGRIPVPFGSTRPDGSGRANSGTRLGGSHK